MEGTAHSNIIISKKTEKGEKGIILIASMAVMMSGCGMEKEQKEEMKTETKKETVVESEQEEEIGVELPIGTDVGTGTMYLATAGGTTENGNVPDVLAEKETILMQMEVDTEGFDSTKISFVYIDGEFKTKEQFGDSQSTIDIEGDSMKEGEHTVSVVQYENNEESGNIITYKEAKYNIVY